MTTSEAVGTTIELEPGQTIAEYCSLMRPHKPRKSCKNAYTNTLKELRVRKTRKQVTPEERSLIELKRFILKLSPRERLKIERLFELLNDDEFYSVPEHFMNFTPADFLERHNISPDSEE